jgi:hypothetical protein
MDESAINGANVKPQSFRGKLKPAKIDTDANAPEGDFKS